MKKILQIPLLLAAMFLTSIHIFAYDFGYDGIYYNITDENAKTVGVTSGESKYTGSVTIPSSVNYKGANYLVAEIGWSAFDGCTGLTSLTIGNSVKTIQNYAFAGCTGLTEVSIPNSVVTIGVSAFNGCIGLTSVTIGNSVFTIGGSAFNGCRNLTSLTIGNSVEEIGGNAFEGCTGLTDVVIPNSVVTIGGSAFKSCRSLASVTIGSSVEEIGWSAFDGCTGLTEVTSLNPEPPTCGNYAFEGAYSATLFVPEDSYNVYANANEWSKFAAIKGIAGVEGIEIDKNAIEVARYDIHGRLISEPAYGINIIKMSDGTMQKVIVK